MIYKDLSTDSVFIDCIYGEKNIYIFIIHHNGNIDFIEISKEDSSFISKNILEFRENIDKTASAVKSKENPITKELFQNKKDEIENISHEIYKVLFQKYIAHYIKGIKRLIISPDGLLHQLPFEALYDGNNYLLHIFDITYIASGREFIRLNKFNKLSSTDDNNTISAFANPQYDNAVELEEQDGKNNDFRTIRAIKKFEKCYPLPKTKAEVLAIKDIYPSIKVFTELNANEDNLKSISNSKILHIATHGIVVENKDEREPLLKCALALSGYNTSIDNKNDYGIFTGLKIVSLNLRNTDLVVLSACESAKGQSDTTEGVASLSRAFMMAGANATIASLWEANDEYSKDFFTQYYKKLSISSDYNKAFKETQLESFNNLQNKGLDHPLFWACFCFFGTGE
jgi:CHAT domain-containing protein